MAVNDFDTHLTRVGNALEQFKEITNELYGLLSTHTHNSYSALLTADYDNRAVTKVQYDGAMVSINDLLNIWIAAGHGTNIDAYLNEVP